MPKVAPGGNLREFPRSIDRAVDLRVGFDVGSANGYPIDSESWRGDRRAKRRCRGRSRDRAHRRRGLARLARPGWNPGSASLTEDPSPDADPLRRAVFVAYLKYEAQPTELPVALFWYDESRSSVGEATLGWYRSLRGPFESHRVPGGHFNLFQEPHLLADRLRRSIDHASEG